MRLGEEEVVGLRLRERDPALDGLRGARGDVELHGALRLVPQHRGAGCHAVSAADIPGFQAGQMATSEFAVDAAIEDRELSGVVFHRQSDPLCPDVAQPEGRFPTHDPALVPGRAVRDRCGGFHEGPPPCESIGEMRFLDLGVHG